MKYLKELYSCIAHSCRTVRKNPLFIFSSFFVDLLFFLLFGTVYSFFSTGIMENLLEINRIIGELNKQLAVLSQGIQDNAALAALTAQQEIIMQHIKSIAVFAVAILISAYILWCIFQGINWHLASWLSHKKKHHFLRYLGKFSLLNLVWLVVLVLIGYVTYKISVYNTLAKMPIVSQNAINYFMLILIAVLFYFAVVSYSFSAKKSFLQSLKNAFVFGVKKAKFYVPAYLLVALLLVVIYFVISLFRPGIMAAVPLNLLFMLPVFAYGRVLFMGISGKCCKLKKQK